MAYVNEVQAFHKMTSVTHGGTTMKGVVGGGARIRPERAMRIADGRQTCLSRPVNILDAEGVVRMLDQASAILWTVAGALLKFNFTNGAGGAGYVEIGKMVGGDLDHMFDFDMGGMVFQETFLLEDSSLTYNVVN